jgi:hypothetical protein
MIKIEKKGRKTSEAFKLIFAMLAIFTTLKIKIFNLKKKLFELKKIIFLNRNKLILLFNIFFVHQQNILMGIIISKENQN